VIVKARVYIQFVLGTWVQVVLVPPALQSPDTSSYFWVCNLGCEHLMYKNCLQSRSMSLQSVYLQYMSVAMNFSFYSSLTRYLLSFKGIAEWQWGWDVEGSLLLTTLA